MRKRRRPAPALAHCGVPALSVVEQHRMQKGIDCGCGAKREGDRDLAVVLAVKRNANCRSDQFAAKCRIVSADKFG
jgi:hypothetical protein